jgi:ELWxxDGT repeat protein
VNGALFFSANDGSHGTELWQSDGTSSATALVSDIIPGSASSSPTNLANANGTLFFAADDGVHGNELWMLPPGTSTPTPSLAVTGFAPTTTAGVAGTFTVTALNADGTTETNYTGIVHFSSSDPRAVLPPDFTFQVGDGGVHTFSATLETAGTESLTARDTNTASFTGTEGGLVVNPAAASSFVLTGFPAAITAGTPGAFTVTAEDPFGNTATGYGGSVHFTSSDARALLPINYTFTAADAGTHTFSATLFTAGTRSITATDTTTASLTGTEGSITVNPAKASKFLLRAPSNVTAGVPFSLTLTVQDAYGNVLTGYTGTVHFSSSDHTALLPSNYTFTAADQGVRTFTGLVVRQSSIDG